MDDSRMNIFLITSIYQLFTYYQLIISPIIMINLIISMTNCWAEWALKFYLK